MVKLYNYLDEPESAYLLKNGTVYFEIKDGEIYKIAGKNLIIAAGEILLNYNSKEYHYREYNFYKDENAEMAEISPANLKNLVLKYSVGYNMNIFFAQMIKITNKVLAKRQSALTDETKVVHEISGAYFEATNILLDIAKRIKFPDIVQLADKFKNELVYETGKILNQQKSSIQVKVEKENIDEFNISFAPGSVICMEGEEGKEMYILNKGRIAVIINGVRVTEINQPGTVIGEIALLLGERRTATLKAMDQVVLSIIKKDNLQEFHKNNANFFLEIGETLAKRINNNFAIIHNIDQHDEKDEKKVAGFLTKDRAEKHILQLENGLLELYSKKGYPQLQELINQLKQIHLKFGL